MGGNRMKHGFHKIICCTAATATVLASVAGCNAKAEPSGTTTGTRETTRETTASETDPFPEPLVSPYSGQWPDNKGSLNGLKYELKPLSSENWTQGRGYYVYGPGEGKYPVLIVIDAGEFPTTGYDVCIVNMEYDYNEFVVTIRDIVPDPDGMELQVLTYPSVGICLSDLPSSIRVVDENGNELERLDTYIPEYEVEPGWIAVIQNGAGEIIYKTYVYETDDGKYSYINVVSTTISWGSPRWRDVAHGSGIVDTRSDIYEVANEFGSCGYVLYPDDTEPHSIYDFING